jgi:hypothetical protein
MTKATQIVVFASLYLLLSNTVFSQIITKEDSLSAGLVRAASPTVLSGYGEAKVEYDLRMRTGMANLTRNVIFIGHRFSDKITFFSELELENAKIVGGKTSGEISLEQLFLKFNLNRNTYLVGGLFIPRIGIINENHLPTTFNGNDRPYTESLVIPSTWRELGIGIYGQVPSVPGLNYSAALMNGLNSAGFVHGTGIREGRFEGSNATASNLAATAALLYYYGNFRMQASAYYGGTAGLSARQADSLQLNSGAFGTPVGLGEFNVQYHGTKGFQFKVLGTYVTIPDAKAINRAYANNTPEAMYGFYAEAGYNILRFFNTSTSKNLLLFARVEQIDLNAKVATNGVSDNFQQKLYTVAGLLYQPLKGVSIKLDYVHRSTGMYNEVLYVTNPYETRLPFYQNNSFINLGFGYSF